MNGLQGVPEWFGGAVVGAVLAALGYIAKLAIEQWRLIHAARASRLASLAELSSLLRAGWVSFAIQNEHAQQLVQALDRERGGDIAGAGYEQGMVDAFPNFVQPSVNCILSSGGLRSTHSGPSIKISWSG
jgi:hypothetical protein